MNENDQPLAALPAMPSRREMLTTAISALGAAGVVCVGTGPAMAVGTSDERYHRGLQVLKQVGGAGYDVQIKKLAEVAPDLARFTVEFPYGDLLSRPGLDLRLRELSTVAALIALGSVQPQLKYHMAGFLNAGGQPRELVELLFVAAAVVGFSPTINATNLVREVFKDRQLAFEAIAPDRNDGTDSHRKGVEALAKLTKGSPGRYLESFAAISPDLARLTVEFEFGEILARGGLDPKVRQLAIISMLAAAGNRTEALRLHIEGGLGAGLSRTEIIEALMQLSAYAGFPTALNAFSFANAVFKELDQRPVPPVSTVDVPPMPTESRASRMERGLATLSKTSAAAGQAVVNSFNDLAPDIGRQIVEHAYGDIFSRPGLDIKVRELTAVAALTAVATKAADVPLRVHINAALTAGATRDEVIETILNVTPYFGYPVVQQAMRIAGEVFAKRPA